MRAPGRAWKRAVGGGHYPWIGASVAGANAGTQKSRDIWASGGSDDEAFFGGLATGVGTAGVEYGMQRLFQRLKNSGEVDEITRQWYDGDVPPKAGNVLDDTDEITRQWYDGGTPSAANPWDDVDDIARQWYDDGDNLFGGEPEALSPTLARIGDRASANAQNVKPLNGYTDVVVHGNADSFFVVHNGKNVWLDQRSLANFLKSSTEYQGGAVRLLSCATGASSNGVAQNLANKLGVNVLAPSNLLWITPSGRMTIGPTAFQKSGEWVLFTPGK